MRISSLLAGFALVGIAVSQSYPECDGVKNENPVLDLTPQVLKNVTNGQSWKLQEGNNIVYIARLQGSAYEMGYAFGELYGPQINENMNSMVDFVAEGFSDMVQKYYIPKAIADLIVNKALIPLGFWALDLNWKVALPYTPQRFQDELQGIADGSNGTVDYKLLRRINMLPELIQAACTVTGVWGNATADNNVYHLRGLDWNWDTPANKYPSVIIYESNEAGSHAIANIGFLGLIGSLTVIGKQGISVGEKVWYYRAGSFSVQPKITYFGKPWTFELRDIAQFANNLQDAQNMFQNSNRTMMIHLGLGSAEDNSFLGVNHAKNVIDFFDDKNYPFYSDAHPQLDGVFFYDKHVQPSGDGCVGAILKANHGNITAETLYSDVAGFHGTGDAQVVVMDPKGEQIWASWPDYPPTTKAFMRSPIHIRLSDYWN